ncbi:metal ABC transporter solute-binding protein, Zn/Mn family [Amphibacillus cookii]|uniref:metal ABC transporter solute-binding protein, Zn/Mn family n=1 Tax=Amphibacillus cookii TaxID=767787 RepID=UPI00195C4C04|nr:zinc ABC transporter substrate-binding protein [Amphibacillus cookii]MBM7540451.1 manganese/zinc/iron transport system substrate-binding protein [Amphibacillus cookii]
MKKIFVTSTLLLVIVLMAACNDTTQTSEEQTINVVTTIAQIGDIVENVGGEHVNVTSLMGPGTDPHMYNAVQSDIEQMDQADIIFYNGLDLEAQMNDVFAQMQADKPTIAVAEEMPESLLLNDPDNPAIYDPHIWFDVTTFSHVVEVVKDQLITLDPDHEEDYQQNYNDYMDELEKLNEYIINRVEEIPEQSRVLVTAHDAFHYFGESYGFEVEALQGLSTEDDYSVQDIQDIVDLVVDREINALFIESSVSDRSINAVKEGAQSEGHEIEIGGELYSDAMGEAGTEEGTYIGMFKANIDTIVDALK